MISSRAPHGNRDEFGQCGQGSPKRICPLNVSEPGPRFVMTVLDIGLQFKHLQEVLQLDNVAPRV